MTSAIRLSTIRPFLLLVALIASAGFSEASRGELCDKSPLKEQSAFSRELLSAVEPGTAYSYGTGYKEAGIYGKDDRVEVERRAYPFRTVGRLVTEWEILDDNGKVVKTSEFTCTATLVGNCHLLSARHCLVDQKDASSRDAPKKRLKTAVFIDALGRRHSTSKTQTGKTTDFSDDYSFLKLSASPGKELGFVPFIKRSSGSHPTGSRFIAAGFSTDLNGGEFLTADMGAQKVSKSPDPKILTLKADTFAGASGGPIFGLSDNGAPYVAAVHTMARMRRDPETGKIVQLHYSDDEKERLSISVATESFAAGLKSFIKNNPCP
ncbi:MAG TPA: serine protease [Pseudobdellovibrionaceae bacterium]|nr:serine protease [Pseudobdellovibrionaceae bacterium]